jgi:hypothetical protein
MVTPTHDTAPDSSDTDTHEPVYLQTEDTDLTPHTQQDLASTTCDESPLLSLESIGDPPTPTDPTPNDPLPTEFLSEPESQESPTTIEEHKAPTENTPPEPTMPADHPQIKPEEAPPPSEPKDTESHTPEPFNDWTTIRTDLGTNPEAQTLLDTYGHPTWHTLEHDLHRHPYLEQRNTFNHAYTNALWHRTLEAARNDGHLTDHTYKDLQDITGVPAGRIRDWTLGEKEPHLERTLRIHEQARQHWEHTLPPEAKAHILDPSLVYHTFKPLLDHPEHHTPDALAPSLETLYHHKKDTHLIIAELKPYHTYGPHELRTIAHTITHHRTHLEHTLTQHLNLPQTHEALRIAVDHDVLYLWRKTTHPDHWLNTYKHELLYLTPHIKEQLIATAQRHLNVNKQQLGQLIDQLTDHPRENTKKPRAIPYELYPTKYSQYLYGDTLHLLLDVTNQPFDTMKKHITQIGRISNLEHSGGIQNPKFPERERLANLRARLIAIALSDCHINKNTHVLTYHEKDENRIEYVRNLFRKLGDTDYKTEELKEKRKRLTITAIVGRLLEQWGVPRGDKHLNSNFRLPQTLRYGSSEAKLAYLAEVIPEDGFFVERNGQMKFGIKRAHVLDAGPKTNLYNFQPRITPQYKAFIQQYGEKKFQTVRHDQPRKRVVLTKRHLQKLKTEAETTQDQQLAKELILIIRNNPCNLIEDEKNLIQSLEIKMKQIFKEIRVYETGRVSTIWEIYTEKEEDTRRWAALALPSSGNKRDAVYAWLTQ